MGLLVCIFIFRLGAARLAAASCGPACSTTTTNQTSTHTQKHTQICAAHWYKHVCFFCTARNFFSSNFEPRNNNCFVFYIMQREGGGLNAVMLVLMLMSDSSFNTHFRYAAGKKRQARCAKLCARRVSNESNRDALL
jgi:hypothetical protein